MPTIGNLVINTEYRGAPLERGLARSRAQLSGFTASIKTFAGSLTGLSAAIGAAGLGLALRDIISQAAEQERQERLLASQIRATGEAAGFTVRQLTEMASQLQEITRFGDETILSAQKVLLSFTNIRGSIFQDALQAAMDLSTIMGQDLQSSVVQVGKALNDPLRGLTALTRIGVAFSQQQRQQIEQFVALGDVARAQQVILAELHKEFGGAAAEDAKSFSGQIEQLKNAFSELNESLGGFLTGNAGGFVSWLKDSFKEANKFFGILSGKTFVDADRANEEAFKKLQIARRQIFEEHDTIAARRTLAQFSAIKGMSAGGLRSMQPTLEFFRDEIKRLEEAGLSTSKPPIPFFRHEVNERALANYITAAARRAEETRGPKEQRAAQLREITLDLASGLIDLNTATRATIQAEQEYQRALGAGREKIEILPKEIPTSLESLQRMKRALEPDILRHPAALLEGTSEAFSAALRGGTRDPQLQTSQQILQEAKEQKRLINDNNRTLKNIEQKLSVVELV
jgi:hypothetical protein